MPELSIEQIEQNFSEINLRLTQAEAIVEANRCLYCFDAPCVHACPTHIDVPSFIKKIASGNLFGSARVIFDANPIGASCAKVCPVEVLCEGACVEKTLVKKPIEIGRLQRYATDYAMQSGRRIFEKGAPNGKSVGIVGSGPAGLSCAAYLARIGYDVTIYERKSLAGGLDTYGMAEYKMSQKASLDEVKLVEDLGVKFELNCEVLSAPALAAEGLTESAQNVSGDSSENSKVLADVSKSPSTADDSDVENGKITFADLQKNHDAVFLAVGLGATNQLNILDENIEGVYDALEYIERLKTRDWQSVPTGKIVAVIGAGNTAIDAVTQAKRLGAEKVLLVYRRTEKDISAYAYEYELAKKDGIEFIWQAAPIEITAGENGSRLNLRCEKTGADNQIFDVPCDIILKAIGQRKQTGFFQNIGIATDEKGRVVVSENMQTSNPKIFAGGDCVNGGAEAVDAAQMGKFAAQGIHFSLSGETIEFAGAKVAPTEKTSAH